MKRRVGFVGLGIMGRGMASCLVKAGYEVAVCNRTRARSEELAAAGAELATTAAAAAAGSEFVITMLADPPAVQQAVLGAGGVIEGLGPGAILIDCSTVDPATTSAVRGAALAEGARFLDAPVAGSKDAAAKGELILMVGGEEQDLQDAMEVLQVISKRIVHAGPPGSGTVVKLCFNLVGSHMVAALSESLVLGVKSGLRPQVILDAIMAGALAAPIYAWKGGCIVDRDFATNFSVKLMHKDLSLMMSAGYSLDVPISL